jgi:hypothetical protein
LREITPELLGEIRKAMPIDFSKRAPFFMSDDRKPMAVPDGDDR